MATTNNIFGRTWNRVDSIVRNAINLDSWSGAGAFLRYGNRGRVSTEDMSVVEMQPRELYVGQLYAAIRTRANRVADLAKNHTKTRLFDDPEAETDGHPYLNMINESPSFSNTQFWRALSTFLDLTGTAYIYVLRNHTSNGKLVGEPQEFKIVNPYNLSRVMKGSDPSEYKYIETRGATWREIPKEQLIICKSFNPFNLDAGFGMVEAAQDDHFAIKQARDYTRKAIKKNIGQRGLLTTDVILSDEKFDNFVSDIKSGETGDFLYGNGPNAISYTDMQIDLDKLALDKINKISTDSLIMVSGASKTLLGIEESGTTRDVSRTQKDLFTENHAIPQLDDILDPLNQDYKNNYTVEYQAKKLEMFVDSPLKIDKETELKEADIEKRKAETAKILIEAGYEAESVTKYLELDEDLTFEERQPQPTQLGAPPPQDEAPKDDTGLNTFLNAFTPGLEVVVKGFETSLANQITNIQNQILAVVIPKLSDEFKNQLDPDESIKKADRDRLERDLVLALTAFGVSVVSLFGSQTTRLRFAEFSLPSEFSMTPAVNKTVKEGAKRAATSHMDTFLKATFSEARKAGLEGLSRDAIVSRLTGSFSDLSGVNATRIARTESYKAVNLSQYEADKQFIDQNNLTGQAYKKWVTQSANPCPYCEELASRDPVPFGDTFIDLGDSIKAEFEQKGGTVTREMVNTFEPVESGAAHPNCSCTYELTIER